MKTSLHALLLLTLAAAASAAETFTPNDPVVTLAPYTVTAPRITAAEQTLQQSLREFASVAVKAPGVNLAPALPRHLPQPIPQAPDVAGTRPAPSAALKS